jgi:hypothetical protein
VHEEDGFCLNRCTCFSWEMTLNFGLDVSFNNMYDSEGIRENIGEVNNIEVSVNKL